MLVSAYLQDWLDTYIIPVKAPSTAACYRRALSVLPPSVLSAPLAAVSPMAIQRAINLKARQHPRAAQLTYAVLHAAMARAVKLGLIPRNPLDLCDKPAHKPARALILDPQQIHAYLVQAAASPSYALLLVMLLCGLRRSEALGLQWADLDLDRLVLHVRRQRLHGQPCPLKTDKSRRDIALAAPVAAELARVRSAQQVRSYHGWVCDVTPDRLRRDHLAVLARAGLPPVTLHGLRHSMATGAILAGCPLKVLQCVLGHSKMQLTADLYADHLAYTAQVQPLGAYAVSVM